MDIKTSIKELRELLKEGNYESAIKKTDEILEQDCNNIKILLTKASLYELTNEIYKAECTYKKILEIEPNNIAAKNALNNSYRNNQETINSDSQITHYNGNRTKKHIKIIITFILFVFTAFFVYLHPSHEEMTCNSNLECKVTHEFLGCIKYNTNIKLAADSKIFANKSCRYSRYSATSGTACTININITDINGKTKKPFIYYYTGYRQTKDNYINADNFIESETFDFNNYLQNPNDTFYISPQSGSFFVIFMIIGFIAIMLIYYVCCFLGIIKD